MSISKKEFFTGLPLLATITFFMQGLYMTALNTAIPAIAADLQRSPFSMQMLIVSYALASALFIPMSGWLSDRYGTRRIFIFALYLYTLASIFCATSPNFYCLVSARVLQGIGVALMVPTARLTLLKSYTPADFVIIFNYVVTPALVAQIIGPVIAGWIVTYAHWRYIFLINMPLCIFGILYSKHHFPNFLEERGKLDISGFFLISLSVLALTATVELLGGKSGTFTTVGILMLATFIFCYCYVRSALKKREPIINISVFKIRSFSIGLAGLFVNLLGIGGYLFLVPLMLQVGLGYSADIAGLILLIPATAAVIVKAIILKILDKFGYKQTLVFLSISIGAIFILMSLQTPTVPICFLLVQLFIQGLLTSSQFTAMNSLTLGSLPQELKSDGNSLHAIVQNLSVGFGIAVATAFLRFFSELGALGALHAAFIGEAVITILSVLIYLQLKLGEGDHLRDMDSCY